MASAALSHLSHETRTQAQLDDKARIELIKRDRWIDYPRATDVMNRLERLLATPKRERMPCMVLHGQSNIGKTLVIRKFQREHPDSFDEIKGVSRRTIVAMQMPATPDQHRFYSALLFELGAPHSASAGVSTLERLARDLLRRIAPRILIVDEVHHLLAGTYREQRASLNLLKYLANDLQLCIVLVGTADATLALQGDTQMNSRFTPFELTKWQINDEFRRFLAAFEKVIPLRKASDLGQRAILEFVLSYSGGLTGEVARLLNEAAEYAIIDRSEMIKMDHLEHAARVRA
jgi:hypothetical protein